MDRPFVSGHFLRPCISQKIGLHGRKGRGGPRNHEPSALEYLTFGADAVPNQLTVRSKRPPPILTAWAVSEKRVLPGWGAVRCRRSPELFQLISPKFTVDQIDTCLTWLTLLAQRTSDVRFAPRAAGQKSVRSDHPKSQNRLACSR